MIVEETTVAPLLAEPQEAERDCGPHGMPDVKSAPVDLSSKVPPESVVRFRNGLPGFPDETEFVIIQDRDERPFAWMQSLKTPGLAFVVSSPFALFPDYRPDVPDQELAALGSPAPNELLLLIIVRVVDQCPPQLHTNLKAPLVINLRTMAANQVILTNETIYSESAAYTIRSPGPSGNVGAGR